jgi:hydroxymethylbilane synthase
MQVRIATRGSALARWQAERVASLLQAADSGVDVELVIVTTTGDARVDAPIHALGGQGVFVREVQQAVLDGRADLAVHSAKDLPSAPADGLELVAVPERADPRDALVGARLGDLEEGAVVATGSVRRRAQLAALRPDLRFAELRGNIPTRMGKVPPGGAIVVALAALERLGLADEAAEVLDVDVMVPQVAQGALAVEARVDDPTTLALASEIDDPISHLRVAAERAFLAAIGGGCDLPVGALATVHPTGVVSLRGILAALDGCEVVRASAFGSDPLDVGRRVAAEVLSGAGPSLQASLRPQGR